LIEDDVSDEISSGTDRRLIVVHLRSMAPFFGSPRPHAIIYPDEIVCNEHCIVTIVQAADRLTPDG
jgi:hypothetical protein